LYCPARLWELVTPPIEPDCGTSSIFMMVGHSHVLPPVSRSRRGTVAQIFQNLPELVFVVFPADWPPRSQKGDSPLKNTNVATPARRPVCRREDDALLASSEQIFYPRQFSPQQIFSPLPSVSARVRSTRRARPAARRTAGRPSGRARRRTRRVARARRCGICVDRAQGD
jgi:hypothetical protein